MMKKGLAIAIICLLTVATSSQHKPASTAPWVSELGYWVLESNLNAPGHHIVRFYNNENMLVYTETLDGVKLNPDKRKVKMKLKKALETSLLSWQKTKHPETDKDYVRSLVK